MLLEIRQLVPHQLGGKHPVVGRSQLEGAFQMSLPPVDRAEVGVVRGVRRTLVVANAGTRAWQPGQEVPRVRRRSSLGARLEVLQRTPGDPGARQEIAQVRASAAL